MKFLVAAWMAASAFAANARADTVIVVTGHTGAPEYAETFSREAERWIVAAKRGGHEVVEIGRAKLEAGRTDKTELLADLKKESEKKNARLWLVMIGHGTYDRKEAKFNLRDDDLTDVELAAALKPVTGPVAVVNAFSASAPFLNRLSAPGRVIVTATRSGSEMQYSRFGSYLADAIADPAADLDKDGQTSLLEAYLAAAARTEEFYKREGRLLTEHPLLDDNGDALGTPPDFFQGIRAVKSPRTNVALDGLRANQWHLVPSSDELTLSPPLRKSRDALELQIESLRAAKGTLPEAEYYSKLDALLLSLARIYAVPQPTTAPAK